MTETEKDLGGKRMGKDTLSILKDIERGDISIEDAEGELIQSLDSQAATEQDVC